jgi:hypothetical protein
MEKDFAEWVGMLEPIFYHTERYTDQLAQIAAVFNYFEVPEFWREPVRVMAQGASYYGAEEWMAKHTGA